MLHECICAEVDLHKVEGIKKNPYLGEITSQMISQNILVSHGIFLPSCNL